MSIAHVLVHMASAIPATDVGSAESDGSAWMPAASGVPWKSTRSILKVVRNMAARPVGFDARFASVRRSKTAATDDLGHAGKLLI